MKNLFGKFSFLIAIALLNGCSVTPPRVDPYTGLLPAGASVKEAPPPIVSAAALKQEKVYLVTGANFEAYASGWKQVYDRSMGVRVLAMMSENDLDRWMTAWSPAQATNKIVLTLRKYFGEVVLANDFAEARAKKAQWIVLFDHAFDMPSTATSTYTNTTSIDLLNGSLKRVIHAEFSEKQERGMVWLPSDNDRLARLRGEDVRASLGRGVGEFDAKLSAMTRK